MSWLNYKNNDNDVMRGFHEIVFSTSHTSLPALNVATEYKMLMQCSTGHRIVLYLPAPVSCEAW